MYWFEDYRHYLKTVLVERRSRNPSYSMRSFARDIGLPVSRVSDLLSEKRHLSPRSGETVAKKLGLSEAETESFLQAISKEQKGVKSLLASTRSNGVGGAGVDTAGENMTLEIFAIVSDWIHYAILELAETREFKSDLDWIAKRLGSSRVEVQLAIARLEKVGLIEHDSKGEIKILEDESISPSDVPSAAIRKHHRQLMAKADQAIDTVPLEEREISTTIFSLDERDLPKAKKLLREFRREMAELLSKRKTKNRVYSLGIQLIPLDLKEKLK